MNFIKRIQGIVLAVLTSNLSKIKGWLGAVPQDPELTALMGYALVELGSQKLTPKAHQAYRDLIANLRMRCGTTTAEQAIRLGIAHRAIRKSQAEKPPTAICNILFGSEEGNLTRSITNAN